MLVVAVGALALLVATSTGAATAPSGSSKRDTKRPSAPRKLAVTSVGSTQISLAWKRAKDNVRVVGYRVYRNGTVAGRTAGTRFTMLGLRCKGTYTASVRALDAAGNASRAASVTRKTKPCRGPSPPPPPPPPAPPAPPPPPAGCTVTLTPSNSISTVLANSSGVVCLSAGNYSQAIVYARPLTSYLTLRCLPGAVLTNPSGHTLRVNEPGAFLRVEKCRFVGSGVAAGGIIDLYGSHIQIVESEVTGSNDNGIYTDEASDHVSILRNRIHDNGVVRDGNQDHGIYLQGDDHLVANNLVYDEPQGFCIQHYDYGRRAVIANNTFVHCGYGRPCCGGIVLGGAGSGPEGVGVRDAVVANNVVAHNTNYSISHDSSPPASCDVHANLSYGTGMESGGWPGGCVGSNSFGDPLFANYATRDLHVLPGSPVIDMGDPARAVSPDFDGVSRPQGARADAGAFER